jgi:sulfite reductase (NADPH) flavoprotein alpha-component
MNDTSLRVAAAAMTVLAYAIVCLAIYRSERRRRGAAERAAAALSAGDGTAGSTLVLFASQTGQAEALAWQSAGWLHAAGAPVRVMSLNEAGIDTLRAARRAFFIVSTYGEGDAPDGAGVFARRVMDAAPEIRSLRYAVLALGDRQYKNFCAFGRRLEAWLQSTGATREFDRIDVDNADPEALTAWQVHCGGDATEAAPDPMHTARPWRLRARTLLNDGSVGGPVYRLSFTAQSQPGPAWQSGDLARLHIADDPTRPRDYSIASILEDGDLQLLVRQERHPDGTLGAASGLLTSTLAVGDSIALSLRPHGSFRLGRNAQRPLILIGNGTGLAGLRGHLRRRSADGHGDNWLIFGERNAEHDFLLREEIENWQASGALRRVDMAFSRDQSERVYVQHRLLRAADEVRAWIDRGAAIYVCGSLKGMASGVDAALRQILGDEAVDELTVEGRYRRDAY